MIDLKKLKELVQLMKDNDLSEIDLREGDETVCIKRPLGGSPAPMAQPANPAPAAPAAPGNPGHAPQAAPAPVDDGLVDIESPMVGTFYTAPNPDSAAFVKVGDSVGPDTVVCVIEAMKVFSEVKAEKAGVIEKVLVKNAEAVEFGQPLFKIRPA